MVKKILLFLLFVLSVLAFSENIQNYPFKSIKTISIGKKEGEIGFVKKIFGGMPHGPQNFFICNDNNVYVPDFANGRINVYDLDLNFLYTILEKENKMASHVGQIFVDQDKNIFLMRNDIGLKKINKNGDTIIFIEKEKLPKKLLNNKNFFLKEGIIFYYNDNSYIESISLKGEIKDNEISVYLLDQLNQKKRKITDKDLIKLKTDKKHIIIGDQYFSTSFRENKAFFEESNEYFKKIKENKSSKEKNIVLDEKKLRTSQFIGYDADHNSYWRNFEGNFKYFIFVFSYFGEVIDAFYFDELMNVSVTNGELVHTAVAPNGDVYFMRNDENGSHFWKIERQW